MEYHWYFHLLFMHHNRQVKKYQIYKFTMKPYALSFSYSVVHVFLEKNILLNWSGFLPINMFIGQLDPCAVGNHQNLDDLVKRSPSYTMDSVPLCDRYITETWYRTKYHVMSSSPPSLSTCGTLYPVWLRGKCLF